MSSEPGRREGFSAMYNRSLFVNIFRSVAGWLYKSIREGFFGTIFTSYNREEALFERGLLGFSARRKRGKNTFFKRIRRRAARGFENSLILKWFGAAADYLLGCGLRMYGAFFVIFGIYTMLMYTIRVFAMGHEGDIIQLIIGGIMVIVSILMLYSKKTLALAIQGSWIASYLFMGLLKIPESKLTQKQRSGSAKYNAAVILGMFVGLMTYFINPVYILTAILALVIVWMIFCQPEAGIIGLIVAVPFLSFFRHPTMLLALGVLTTATSHLIKCFRGKRIVHIGLIDIFIAIFGMNFLLGGIVSVGGGASLRAALIYSVLLIGYFLTVNLIRTREHCLHVLAALAVSLTISSLYGTVQYLFGNITANWLDTEMFSYIPGRATSFFDNPNVLGGYLILIIPLLLVLTINTRGFKPRFLLMLSTGAVLLCLVWTWSRGAWLGALAGIILLFLIYSQNTLATLLALGALSPLMSYLLPGSLVGRFMSIGNMADSSTYYRVISWRGVIRMLREVWIGGIGVGQAAFEQVYPVFAYAGTEAAPHAHNLILQLLTETGIFGIVIFAAIIFFFIQKSFEFIKKAEGVDRMIVAAGVSGIFAILVMGVFDHIWYNFRVFFLFWIVMALTVSFINSINKEKESIYDKSRPDSADITI